MITMARDMKDFVPARTPGWQERAACTDKRYHPDDWFPERGEQLRALKARGVCFLKCPVRRECLTDALDRDEPYGIRGGWPPQTRKRWLTRLAKTGRRYDAEKEMREM